MTNQLEFNFTKGIYFIYTYCENKILRDVDKVIGDLPSKAELAQNLPVGYYAELECIK